MNNSKFYAFVQTGNDVEVINSQKKIIEQYERHYDGQYQNNSIDKIIEKLSTGDNIVVADINVLGHTTAQILQTILEIRNKNITLHIAKQRLVLYLRNDILFNVLDTLFELEKLKKTQQHEKAKQTHQKNKTKAARKSGKKTSSMFDRYKRTIIAMDKKGLPKREILKAIKQKDLEKDKRLQNTTVQALGQYIKRQKEKQKSKKNKDEFIRPLPENHPFAIQGPNQTLKLYRNL